jgi:hypothetical protein
MPKKLRNLPEPGITQAMATIRTFGAFRLDVNAEILFRARS